MTAARDQFADRVTPGRPCPQEGRRRPDDEDRARTSSPSGRHDAVGRTGTDGECVWINRHEALALVSRLAVEGGHPLQRLGERELAQRLYRAGVLGHVEESRETLTVRKMIRGQSHSGLLCLRASALGARQSADRTDLTTDAEPDKQ